MDVRLINPFVKAVTNVFGSLPSAVIGEQFMVSNSKTAPRIVLPCQCELGKVDVEVGMEIGEGMAPSASSPTHAANGV